MYMWNHNSDNSQSFTGELLNCNGIREVKIATAFFSEQGLAVLEKIKHQYGLKRNEIVLYLSAEFSMREPHVLLASVNQLCETRVVFERTFHPKVYLLQGEENKLIHGSANFTGGGLCDNVEFISHLQPDEAQLSEAKRFFAYCNTLSVPVDDAMIAFYADCADEIVQAHSKQQNIRRKLKSYIQQDDPFLPDDYDLSACYFSYQDYETFFPRYRDKNHKDIRERRKAVQDKMLRIHQKIYPQIESMGIACHKREENITSMIVPCVFNHHLVAWNGVRYGKTPEEIDALNYAGEKDDLYQFQKHGCLQYAIVSTGFEINLFLAVKNDAVDRHHLHQHLRELRPNIERELKKLKGYGMEWVINDDTTGEQFRFDVDSMPASDFCEFFKKHDQDGRESYMLLFYEPNDEYIATLEDISTEIVESMKLLLPLYNVMVYRPKI